MRQEVSEVSLILFCGHITVLPPPQPMLCTVSVCPLAVTTSSLNVNL